MAYAPVLSRPCQTNITQALFYGIELGVDLIRQSILKGKACLRSIAESTGIECNSTRHKCRGFRVKLFLCCAFHCLSTSSRKSPARSGEASLRGRRMGTLECQHTWYHRDTVRQDTPGTIGAGCQPLLNFWHLLLAPHVFGHLFCGMSRPECPLDPVKDENVRY